MIPISILLMILILSLTLDGGDRIACFLFSAVNLFHELFFIDLQGNWYFLTDAFGMCLVVTCIFLLNYSKLIERVIVVCISLIVIDFIGLVMWYKYLPMDAINLASIVLYVAMACLTLKGSQDERLSGVCRVGTVFRAYLNKKYILSNSI